MPLKRVWSSFVSSNDTDFSSTSKLNLITCSGSKVANRMAKM